MVFGSDTTPMSREKRTAKKGVSNRPAGVAYRLFFRETCLGDISDVYGESHWMTGTLTPTPGADSFRDFFQWMVDEANVSVDPPFDEALLDEENWFIEQGDGERAGISLPAVQKDSEIGWRWR